MGTQDSDQHRVPGNTPDRKTADPKLPGEENEDIRKGAQQEDQLEKLHPDTPDETTPGTTGSDGVKQTGEEDSEAIGSPS